LHVSMGSRLRQVGADAPTTFVLSVIAVSPYVAVCV